MAKNKATLKWSRKRYAAGNSMAKTGKPIKDAEVRAEYTRLRDISEKRLKRLASSGWEWTELYKENVGKFKKLSDVSTSSEMTAIMDAMARFVSSESASVSGLKKQRAQSIKTLHESGYDFVNEENFREFTQFMEDWRAKSNARLYDSKRVADLYALAQQKGISTEDLLKDFSVYQKNLAKIEKLKPKQIKGINSSEDLKNALERNAKYNRRRTI